jgi:hypothetical protein
MSIAAALPRGSVGEARPISELQDESDRAQSFKDIDPLFPKRTSDAASKIAQAKAQDDSWIEHHVGKDYRADPEMAKKLKQDSTEGDEKCQGVILSNPSNFFPPLSVFKRTGAISSHTCFLLRMQGAECP